MGDTTVPFGGNLNYLDRSFTKIIDPTIVALYAIIPQGKMQKGLGLCPVSTNCKLE